MFKNVHIPFVILVTARLIYLAKHVSHSNLKPARNSYLFWSNYRDSEDEWETWTFLLRDQYFLGLLAHVFFSQFVSRWVPHNQSASTPYRLRLGFCIGFVLFFFSIKVNFLCFLCLSFGYSVALSIVYLCKFIFEEKASYDVGIYFTWVYVIFFLPMLSTSGFDAVEESYFIATITRTSSFLFDYFNHQKVLLSKKRDPPSHHLSYDSERKTVHLSLKNLSSDLQVGFEKLCIYNFYLPTLILGPVIPFSDMLPLSRKRAEFHDGFITRLKSLKKKIIRIIAIYIAAEVFFHQVPIFEMAKSNLSEVKVIYLYLTVLFDIAKAYLIYQLASVFLYLDNFTCPAQPTPLHNLYLFGDTFFDRKLQYWLVKYIYDPLAAGEHDPILNILPENKNVNVGGIPLRSQSTVQERERLMQKNLEKASPYMEAKSAAITFFIVFLSSGCTLTSFWFCFLNWAGLSFEYYARRTQKSKIKKEIHLRLLTSLNLILILLFNFIGIAGHDQALEVTYVLFTKPMYLMLLFSISFIHVNRLSK